MFGLDAAAIALICVGASALIGAIYNKYQAYKHNKAIAASEEEVLLGDDTSSWFNSCTKCIFYNW
ncbi:MAG UNVERIFIED_CONTAM: hypothetical protein LVQ98_09085 [Rickettsiaceae bacterium]